MRTGDRSRFLLSYEVERCHCVDLRHPQAADLYELARQPWQSALKAGTDPASWEAVDRIRAAGHIGLIDPSRQQPGVWHVTLFQWNEGGGPLVRSVGDPVPITLHPAD